MNETPSSITPTLPLSCPRCRVRAAGDWCCWELDDLEKRIDRGETIRQLCAAFPGKSSAALRGAAWRYKLGAIVGAGERARRKRCAAGCGAFVGKGEDACDACNRPRRAEARAA